MDTRETLIYLARTADIAERHEDMVTYVRGLVKAPVQLTIDERNLFTVAFKNVTSKLRNGWRRMEYLERITSQHSHKAVQAQLITREKELIAHELSTVCEEVLTIIEDKLLDHAGQVESKVFYLKLRGDYARYLSECATSESVASQYASISQESYTKSYQLAAKLLPATHVTRLGLALNYSVFFYDIRKSPERACHVAKNAFDAAIEELDVLSEENYKESVMILQLIRDNLSIWIEELGGEVPAQDDEVAEIYEAEEN